MSSRVIVVAGALTQPHWVPPAELRARLGALSAVQDLQTSEPALPPSATALPRELAHDRWLRLQTWPEAVSIAPGAMSAVRRVAPHGAHRAGWLVEPVHFHLAKDHVVLLAGAAHDLDAEDAAQLVEAILPLLEEDLFRLEILAPGQWLLQRQPGAAPLQLDCSSADAAAGRNVEGYLPAGSDTRRYRKLLNEIQMTWHQHPVNERREAGRRLPINSIWLSGPVTGPALAAWNHAVADGRYEVEESLLAPRLADDRSGWLDALQALDARLQAWLAAARPPAILLCGDTTVRWLQRRPAGASAAAGRAAARGLGTVARWLQQVSRGGARDGQGQAGRPVTAADPLVLMFSEAP